jgi:hypothetical protein
MERRKKKSEKRWQKRRKKRERKEKRHGQIQIQERWKVGLGLEKVQKSKTCQKKKMESQENQ